MRESHSRSPSEDQMQRARELDVRFTGDISGQALDLLITARCRELDPPPVWLSQVAEQLGLGNSHSTRRELYHLIEAELMISRSRACPEMSPVKRTSGFVLSTDGQ